MNRVLVTVSQPVVNLREVTKENWLEALKLEMYPDQYAFVPSVAVCLAKAYIKPENGLVIPFGVYSGEVMVGFFTITHDANRVDRFWINGFQIDKNYQRKGYGKAALAGIIILLQKLYPACRTVGLTLAHHNEVARKLYESHGFVNTGTVYEGETVYLLQL